MTALAVQSPAVIELTLPWPPSVNTYWRNFNGRMLISREGRAYRSDVVGRVPRELRQNLRGRLAVSILALPPDRRRRDLDNALKAPLDALLHAQVYEDDGQIDRLTIERGERVENGELRIRIEEVAL